MPLSLDDWWNLERVMHADPAGRGLASFSYQGDSLDSGQLQAATMQLVRSARAVGIVTGFSVVVDGVISAETDGPPGALFLARALSQLGVEVALISDCYGVQLLEAGTRFWGLDRVTCHEIPFEADVAARGASGEADNTTTGAWCRTFFNSDFGQRLTHLISIERPGPSHTAESIRQQYRDDGGATLARFTAEVPAQEWNHCHNMRGESIQERTAKAHCLFEWIPAHGLPITTIGMIDGGNEIGSGALPWHLLCQAIARGPAGQIACRIATDYVLIAGVSNWAAYALALALGATAERPDLIATWNEPSQRALIEALVHQAGAVDGATRRREATVDSLPLDQYLAVLAEMRAICGVSPA